MEKLSLILWRERELLDLLAYRLEVEQLVLASGRTRWLALATREVEDVVGTLRETEVLRAMAADEAAQEHGLPPEPSLTSLAGAAGEPWRTILLDHRDAFVAVTREIGELAETNRTLISAGYRSARDTLMSIRGSAEGVDGYSPDGSAVVDAPRRHLVDKAL